MFDTYKIVKDLEKEGKFNEKQAASIVKAISGSVEHNVANLATKQDVERLGVKVAHLEDKMATKEDLAKLEIKIAENHSSLLKWVFGISIGIGSAVVGVVYYMMQYVLEHLQTIQTIVQNVHK